MTVRDSVYAIRPYADEDETRVLELLRASLGGGPGVVRAADLFRWKHLENPFGRSVLLVAEDGDAIIGLRAFLRWRLRAGDRTVRAVRAVDTATHPSHRRRGVFSGLTEAALEELTGDTDLVFNTPNERSLAGYRKLGWVVVGRVPVSVRVRRPLRLAAAVLRAAGPDQPGPIPTEAVAAGEVLVDPRLATLLSRSDPAGGRLVTDRDQAYLRWRYGAAPALRYHAVIEEDAGALRGVAVFRLRWRRGLREAAVAEVLAEVGDRPTVRRLLRRVKRAAAVDHVVGSFPPPLSHDALRSGFVRAPVGPTLAVRPLTDFLIPSPTRRDSWWLTLGDLEVF